MAQDYVSDLGLDIHEPGKPGRKAIALAPTIVRDIDESDLARISVDRGIKPIEVKKLSERHHSLARLIAAGTPVGEAAAIVGIQGAWASSLQTNPAFQDLLSMYRERVEFAYDDTLTHIAGLAKDAVIELRDRLEAEPESFTNKQLLDVFEKTADRSGHGPTSTQVSVNANLADRIDAARERAKAARLQAIEATFEEVKDEDDS